MNHFKPLAAATLVAATLGVTGCGGDAAEENGDAAAQRNAVTVKTFMFEPDPIRVESGTRVRWTNQDQTVHTVTSGSREQPDGRFDGELAAGAELSHTFDEPGTYRYFCSRHSGPGMEGEVVVE